VLQDTQEIPGIDGDDGLHHRRQVLRLPQHAAPLFQSLVLIPVEVIDQRIFFPGTDTAGPLRVFDGGVRSGQDRIDRGELGVERAGDVRRILPLPFSDRTAI